MTTNVKENQDQFNRQADIFANYSGTKDVDYMEGLFTLTGLSEVDNLLDVACGSGSFVAYVSKKINSVTGIDVSDRLISIAKIQAQDLNLTNVGFVCGNVEELPFRENTFSVVLSKSAFHHFSNPERVFDEMYRVCQPGGVICIDDITTYEDKDATLVIDQMDKLMDISHNRRMSIEEITQLFLNRGTKVVKMRINEFERTVLEYQGHALQTPDNATKLDELVSKTVGDGAIHDVLYGRNGEIFFLNRGFTIVGKK